MILNPVILFTLVILFTIYYWYSFKYFDQSVSDEEKSTASKVMSRVSLGIFSTSIIYLVLNLAYYFYMTFVFTSSVSKYSFITELIGNVLMKL